MPILGDFAAKYGAVEGGDRLGVPLDDLYRALVDTAENTVSESSVELHQFVLKHLLAA